MRDLVVCHCLGTETPQMQMPTEAPVENAGRMGEHPPRAAASSAPTHPSTVLVEDGPRAPGLLISTWEPNFLLGKQALSVGIETNVPSCRGWLAAAGVWL